MRPTHCPIKIASWWGLRITVCDKRLMPGAAITAINESPINHLHCPIGHYSFTDGELTSNQRRQA